MPRQGTAHQLRAVRLRLLRLPGHKHLLDAEGSRPDRAAHSPATPGRAIEGLTADVAAAWLEARSALGVGAPTACEHMCRKILLHIAVVHDGNPKFTFAQAIDHLLAAGVITAQWEPWVKQIKDNGNEAAHELQPVSMDRARHTLEFTQQLLQLVFETKHRMRQFEPKA